MAGTTTGNAVILERLESLQCDTADIKSRLDKMGEEAVKFRIDYEVRHASVETRAVTAHSRLDDHDKEFEKIRVSLAQTERIVASLALQAKIVAWVGGILMTSVLILIWSIITHQVNLSF